MLDPRAIRKINDQIIDELRTVDSIASNDHEKMAALERIAKLKTLLEPTPVTPEPPVSRKTILKELAAAVLEARDEARQRNQPFDLFEALFGTRRF